LPKALRQALATLPRGELDEDLGTDVRMNALEETPRIFREDWDGLSALAMGYRLGECMEDPDPAAIAVCARLLSAPADVHKGVLALLYSVKDGDWDAALARAQEAVAALAAGQLRPEDLAAAAAAAAERLERFGETPENLDVFWLSQNLLGLDAGPAEMAQLCREVTASEIAELAAGLQLDAALFLRAPAPEEGT